MPEKPEVITVVKALKPNLIGRKITDVEVFWDNIIEYPDVESFKKKLVGQKINDITTRGKWLVFHLSKDILLIHLRMEGKFFFRRPTDIKNKHEHVFFTLDNGEQLRFHDVRKFGKMYLLPKDTYLNEKPLKDMGYEYDDSLLTASYLYNKLKSKSIPIKTSLLDQSIITGIGNIYDDEILFLSKISPHRKSNLVTMEECDSIIKNTRTVLNHAIELGGTTIKSFTSSEGVHGLFQNELLVHGKKNGKCPTCGTTLKVDKINGRSSYYCPKCQI